MLFLGIGLIVGAFLGGLIVLLYSKKAIAYFNQHIDSIATGDYKAYQKHHSKLLLTSSEKLAHLCKHYEQTFEEMVITALKTTELSDELQAFIADNKTGMDQVSTNANVLSNNAQTFVEILNRTTSQTHVMNQHIRDIDHLMQETQRAAKASTEKSKRSQADVKTSVQTVSQMLEATQAFKEKIEGLLNAAKDIELFARTIENIAENTSLLALNASIEAARAGESGKGFAVVAEEIRKLSLGTTNSLTQINESVKSITLALDEASAATETNVHLSHTMFDQVNQTDVIFSDLLLDSEETQKRVQKVFEIVNAMDNGIQGVNAHMEILNDKTSENQEEVQSANAITSNLTKELLTLDQAVLSLKKLSTAFYTFVSEKSIDVILKNQLDALLPSVSKLTDTESCVRIAKSLNIGNLQILDHSGKIIKATEQGSLGLDLFRIYPPYEAFFKEKKKEAILYTPIVTRLDGFYAKFAARVLDNQLIIVEYAFNLKNQ